MADRSRLSPAGRRVLFWWCLALTLVLAVALGALGGPLNTAAAPGGIVSLELACSEAEAAKIVRSWEQVSVPCSERSGLEQARLSLWLDMGFLVAYPATLLMACFWAAGGLRRSGFRRSASWVRGVGWLQPIAGLADLVENWLLLQVIDGQFSQVAGARWAAGLKFTLVFAGFLAFLWGAVVREAPGHRPRPWP